MLYIVQEKMKGWKSKMGKYDIDKEKNVKLQEVLDSHSDALMLIKIAYNDFGLYYARVYDDFGTLTNGLLCEFMMFVTSWASDAQHYSLFVNNVDVNEKLNALKKALWADMELFYEVNSDYKFKALFGKAYMGGYANY